MKHPCKISKRLSVLILIATGLSQSAHALPTSRDRVYTGDQISNTVSVIDPSDNHLLGEIKLGNPRPDVLSPLNKGEVNVHGLGFSPDHKTILAVSTASNAVTLIDTATNKIKGTVYVGRSPHEGFFTRDGKEVWVVVRGENYISVIDPVKMKEKSRIPTAAGPGMVIFNPNGKEAYVCNSFTPVFEIIDLKKKKVVKQITVASPFSPFLQITPDLKEIWLTHKDIGKVTRIDIASQKVIATIDTGFITNHLAFAKTSKGTFAYVTVGGENLVKVYTTAQPAAFVSEIPVGALPHGIWASDDSSRVFVGLENGDGVAVIDTEKNEVVKTIPIGQAPQALVFVSNAVPTGAGLENLTPRLDNPENIQIKLKAHSGAGNGFAVVRSLGPVDSIEVSVYKMKPQATYDVFLASKENLLATLKTNDKGMGTTTVIGPTRSLGVRSVQDGSQKNTQKADAKELQKNKLLIFEKGAEFKEDQAQLFTEK